MRPSRTGAAQRQGNRGLTGLSEAIEHYERALRLSPRDPRIFIPQAGIGLGCVLAGRYDEATAWAARALQVHPEFPVGLAPAWRRTRSRISRFSSMPTHWSACPSEGVVHRPNGVRVRQRRLSKTVREGGAHHRHSFVRIVEQSKDPDGRREGDTEQHDARPQGAGIAGVTEGNGDLGQ